MKSHNVIPAKYLPTRLPFTSTALHFLLLSYYDAPVWLWSVWITLMVIIWILIIGVWWNQNSDETLLTKTINIDTVIKNLKVDSEMSKSFETKVRTAMGKAVNKA